jgi:putative heme-binding domain-containing protein
MYGEGGDVGPELTGSDRGNLDYVLQNVLDPSASVAAEYRVTNIATADGRLVSGLLREQTPGALVVQTVNGKVVVPRDEVEEVRASPSSMMPEGLLDQLSESEVRDLVAYLGSKAQVPPAAPGAR